MASGKPSTDEKLTAKHLPRTSTLLKDYLRDDLSSCSSSGFTSFPRRQCCSTVRFLLEKDLQAKRNRLLGPSTGKRRSSRATSSTISALQKASQAVIKAVKLLPFPSISGTSLLSQKKKVKNGFICRSLSRKVLSSSFWRKAVKEEGRRGRSFREFLEGEKPSESDQNKQSSSISLCAGSSGSSGNSWGESEFTWEILGSSSGNSESSIGSKQNTLDKMGGEDSNKTKEWASEEKEQLSPVSVLDWAFEDEEEINSPSDSTCYRVEGHSVSPSHRHKHMHKSRRLDGIASLKPVELEKRLATSEAEDEHKSKAEESAWRLVNEIKISIPSNCLGMNMAEKLLSDLFKQSKDENIERVAENWIRGESQEVNYMREIEECGRWRNISEEGGQEVGMELEFEVLTSLVNELVLELTSC